MYSAFDVFLMPSLYEGLPVVAIEAQASGIPTLLSNNIDESVVFSDKVDMLQLIRALSHGSKSYKFCKIEKVIVNFREIAIMI